MWLSLLSHWWSLLLAVSALADDSEDRRSKLPYIADAVGNSLPPPSSGPATVGSPVNLLTPDRYEFYTFDESGELVKRLMTLEEIQAIVAAGEETEGLVTFANDNQPTIAFNFSEPAYTKVHSVVTNVQNVLKAQMEAHKNKPHTQPTLDTPDVSDSWSLILPSIFGNTGVDIVPDKTTGTFTTPETETLELHRPVNENSLSKEGSNHIFSSTSTKVNEELKDVPVTEKISPATEKTKVNPTSTIPPKTTTTTITTPTTKPTYSTTSKSLLTTTKTTKRPPTVFSSTITQIPSSVTSTTSKPLTTPVVTTKAPPATTTTFKPRTTTSAKPRTTTTTRKPTTQQAVKTTPKLMTLKLTSTTESHYSSVQADNEGNYTIQVQTAANTPPTAEKTTVKYEKISPLIPISTATYVTERTTRKPTQTTRASVAHTSSTKRVSSTSAKISSTTSKLQPSITTYKPIISTTLYGTTLKDNFEKLNTTTITTQSVSPSTTVASTEISTGNNNNNNYSGSPLMENVNSNHENEKVPELPLFDVAISFSQIATDLGGNYRPIPTTSDILDSTKMNDINPESKESLEIDIPADNVKEDEKIFIESTDKNIENFVKITTIDPHEKNNTKKEDWIKETPLKEEITNATKLKPTMSSFTTTTIDPVLSESMEDLLSQVVNQAPQTLLDGSSTANKSDDMTAENITDNTTRGTSKPPETTTESLRPNVIVPKINVSSTESKKTVPASTSNKLTKPDDKDATKLSKPSPINAAFYNKPQHSSGIKDNFAKPLDHEKIKLDVTESVKLAEKLTQNLKTNNKTKTKVESTSEAITNSNVKTLEEVINITAVFNNTKQETSTSKDLLSQITISSPIHSVVSHKEQSKYKEVPMKNFEIIPPLSTEDAKNKLSSNKENDKKDTNTEPKAEEFKKKNQKVNIDEKELANERNNSWKLISTVAPPKANDILNGKIKTDGKDTNNKKIVLDVSQENQGLEITTKDLEEDVAQFTELCNELAFRYWQTLIENIDKRRSFVLSPYSITSMLAMMFMGARGATSGEMNEILKLDDMVTFNPHFTLKNISDSLEMSPLSGVAVSAFIREIFSDRSKGKILTFYKERAQHFYNGHIEEINFKLISDIIRRRTNLLVKRYTWGKVVEYMKSNSITMQPPLAAFSVNIFETDCSKSSVEGRDGEMYFVVSPNVRQRRLVPVPAVVYRDGFLAGYDPVLDATAAALGNSVVSILFLMPGQQGNIVHADNLENLEKRLLESNPTTVAWNRLLRTLLPRIGLELQIPRFSHKSVFNVSSTLQQMGLKDLFDAEHADLGGVIGPSKDLYLSDMVQSTTFVTCGGGVIGEQHHIEEYPETVGGPTQRRTSRWAMDWDEPRDYQRAFHDPHDVGEAMHLPLHLRPRQARVPARNTQPARLKFDRPFLFFVRHNPTGMILYVGRYNPRLLP